jgi:hypothetical protein
MTETEPLIKLRKVKLHTAKVTMYHFFLSFVFARRAPFHYPTADTMLVKREEVY